MKKTISIAIACAIGAGIGTLIGVAWFRPLSFLGYIVAILSGGGIAYLIYDIEELYKGIRHSYAAMKEARANRKPKPDLSAYKKYRRLVRLSCYYGYAEFSGYINLILIGIAVASISLVVLIDHSIPPAQRVGSDASTIVVFGRVYGAIALIINLCALFQLSLDDPAGIEDHESKRLRILENRKSLRWIKKYCKESEAEIANKKTSLGLNRVPKVIVAVIVFNPVFLFLYSSIFLICKALCWSIINIRTVLAVIKNFFMACLKFLALLFRYIHSDRRLLCFFDGALGTLIGLHFHSPLIGLAAGALVGIVHYELISVRLLKLQPKH